MYLERDNDTDRLQKTVHIYTFVFTGTYTGPFCHNPVESRLIPLDSGSIPLESSGFLWNPVESGGMDAFLQESVGHQKVQGFLNNRVLVDPCAMTLRVIEVLELLKWTEREKLQ